MNNYIGICGEDGDNLFFVFDEISSTLIITGKGQMESYGYCIPPWNDYLENIKSVIIENGVTSIGNYAFYNCESLSSITIPDSVTRIGVSAFHGCASLRSVTIPNSVTRIESGALFFCTSLKVIYIPSSVTVLGDYSLGYYRNENHETVKDTDFTIYGEKNSVAERYANANGFEFASNI